MKGFKAYFLFILALSGSLVLEATPCRHKHRRTHQAVRKARRPHQVLRRSRHRAAAIPLALRAAAGPWTSCFRKVFLHQSTGERERSFERHDINPFSQMIVSWNAFRPKKGFYRLHGRVRDSRTKKWLAWHRMFDWGANVQRSYSTSFSGSSYHYVRLELPRGRFADGFQVKVEARDGAPLADVVALFVSVSRMDLFTTEGQGNKYATYESCCISPFPCYSQMVLDHVRFKGLCSPTSLCMVMSYVLSKSLDPGIFADYSYDEGMDVYGSWQCNTAHAFDLADGAYFAHVQRLPSFGVLHQLVAAGTPVVVSVRGEIPGAPKPYPNGHLLVVKGFDQKSRRVICCDPAAPSVDTVVRRYRLKDFLAAWERSFRLAYVVSPVNEPSLLFKGSGSVKVR